MASGARALGGVAGEGVPRVVVTRDLGAAANERLRSLEEAGRLRVVQHMSEEPMPAEDLARALEDGGASGVLCLLSDAMSADVLAKAGESLSTVSTMSVGVSHIDLEYCRVHGVSVGYTPGVLTDATADLAVSLLLATARLLPSAISAARDGGWTSWKPFWMTGKPVAGATVGIVGLGRIGMGIADRLAGFRCPILYSGASGPKEEASEKGFEYVAMDDLLARSDFVVLACALTPSTHHLIGAPQLEAMRNDAMLINISRGEVVDQDALITALQNKTIAAAGLDVTTPEPLPTDSPLFALDNCVVLPHIGSATTTCREEMADIALNNLLDVVLEHKEPSIAFQ